MVYTHSLLPLSQGPQDRIVPSSLHSLLPTWSLVVFLLSVLPLKPKPSHISHPLFQPGFPSWSSAPQCQTKLEVPLCTTLPMLLLWVPFPSCVLQHHFSSSIIMGASPCNHSDPPHPSSDSAWTPLPCHPGHPVLHRHGLAHLLPQFPHLKAELTPADKAGCPW